jgi:hypothetical protein
VRSGRSFKLVCLLGLVWLLLICCLAGLLGGTALGSAQRKPAAILDARGIYFCDQLHSMLQSYALPQVMHCGHLRCWLQVLGGCAGISKICTCQFRVYMAVHILRLLQVTTCKVGDKAALLPVLHLRRRVGAPEASALDLVICILLNSASLMIMIM